MINPRRRTRPLLDALVEQLRARRRPIETVHLHALRQYGVACYELGRGDAHGLTTRPPPRRAADDPAPEGSYLLVEPQRDDEL